jgi:ketosteroid isomerase-like protein
MTTILACVLVAFLDGRSTGQPAVLSGEALRAAALRVIDLDLSRQLGSASAATVDALLALYADDVVYEHPNAHVVIRGKDVVRRNMLQFIGSVRAVHADPPRVTVGPGVAVVETRTRMEVDDGGKWVPVTRHGVRVIEFDARGLVRRVIDYPW